MKADAQEYVEEDLETIQMISPIKPEDFPADESDSDTEAPINQKDAKEDVIEENMAELIRRLIKLGHKEAANALFGESSDEAYETDEQGDEDGDDKSPEKKKDEEEELIRQKLEKMKEMMAKREKVQNTRKNNWTQHQQSEVVLGGQSKEEI